MSRRSNRLQFSSSQEPELETSKFRFFSKDRKKFNETEFQMNYTSRFNQEMDEIPIDTCRRIPLTM